MVRYHIFAHLRTFEDVTGVLYMTCCSSTALLFAIQIPFYRTYPISVYSVLQRGVVDDIRHSDKEDARWPRTYSGKYAVYAVLKVGDSAHCQLVARLVLIALLVRSH